MNKKAFIDPRTSKVVAQVFLGMFATAGFSHNTVMDPNASPRMQELAEGLADIFLNYLKKLAGCYADYRTVALPSPMPSTHWRQKPAQLIDTPVTLVRTQQSAQFSCHLLPLRASSHFLYFVATLIENAAILPEAGSSVS